LPSVAEEIRAIRRTIPAMTRLTSSSGVTPLLVESRVLFCKRMVEV